MYTVNKVVLLTAHISSLRGVAVKPRLDYYITRNTLFSSTVDWGSTPLPKELSIPQKVARVSVWMMWKLIQIFLKQGLLFLQVGSLATGSHVPQCLYSEKVSTMLLWGGRFGWRRKYEKLGRLRLKFVTTVDSGGLWIWLTFLCSSCSTCTSAKWGSHTRRHSGLKWPKGWFSAAAVQVFYCFCATSLECMPRLILTHGDVGQLVCGAMRVDTVEVRPIAIHPTEDQCCTDVALIPKQHKKKTFEVRYEYSPTKVALLNTKIGKLMNNWSIHL